MIHKELKWKLICDLSTNPTVSSRDEAEVVPDKGCMLQNHSEQRHEPHLELFGFERVCEKMKVCVFFLEFWK